VIIAMAAAGMPHFTDTSHDQIQFYKGHHDGQLPDAALAKLLI
jgi:hypothetical protein